MTSAEPVLNSYDPDFFLSQAGGSRKSAAVVVPLVLAEIGVRSIIDVGCGVGTWAAEFLAHGVQDVTGIDGDYVDRSNLAIPADCFRPQDLNTRINAGRTFDLAVCLEVAEHLPASRAAGLIEDLTRLAPCVLFSAAIPGQTGTNHINEQPLSYWVEIFSRFGYCPADLIRPAIWKNPDVEWWYKQNAVLFARKGHPLLNRNFPPAMDLVHPDVFNLRCSEIADLKTPPTLGFLIPHLPGAVTRSLRKRFLGKS